MKIMVITPHPDDETLGAGGTLHRFRREGNEIYWLIVTHVNSEFGYSEEQIKNREIQLEKVVDSYGFSDICNLKFTPASLTDISEADLIAGIKAFVMRIQPEIVLLSDPHDAHSDHKAVFEASMVVLKAFRAPFVKRILTMEIVSESNFGDPFNRFEPNHYVDISDYLEQKIETMKLYETEIDEHPFPRSLDAIRSLALLRGSEAGCRAAEAFHVIKEIE